MGEHHVLNAFFIISIFRQEDTGFVRPYGLAALGEPQGPGEAVEVILFVLSRFSLVCEDNVFIRQYTLEGP